MGEDWAFVFPILTAMILVEPQGEIMTDFTIHKNIILLCAMVLVFWMPWEANAQDFDLASFDDEDDTGLQPEFWKWSGGVGIGYGLIINEGGRGGGSFLHLDLRRRLGKKSHFHFSYRRQDYEVTGGIYHDVNPFPIGKTVNQYHLLYGWHGYGAFSKNSWSYLEFGPVVEIYSGYNDLLDSTGLAVALNVGMILPMGDFAAADFGMSLMSGVVEPKFGQHTGPMFQVHAGFHFH